MITFTGLLGNWILDLFLKEKSFCGLQLEHFLKNTTLLGTIVLLS